MSVILILANSSTGLYDFRAGLLRRLLAEGHEVVVSLPDDQRREELSALGCTFVHTELNRRGMNPIQDFALLRAYRRMLREYRPDLALTYTVKPNIYGGLLCRRQGVPYITTITGLGSTFERGGMVKRLIVFLYRRALRESRCIFFQNAENRSIFAALGIKGKKSALVNGSGVDLQRHPAEPYPGHRDDVVRFLYVGRLMREKGSDEYLEAARRLHEKYNDRVSFAVIGYPDEDYQEKLDAAVSSGILKYVPYQKDIHPYLREADVIVLPSYHEGMSNVLMEGAATARPLLATAISGCREIIEDGVTGYLFRPGSAEALIQAMERMLRMTPEERARMGRFGREKMEREFDRQCIIDAYMKEILPVLEQTYEAV